MERQPDRHLVAPRAGHAGEAVRHPAVALDCAAKEYDSQCFPAVAGEAMRENAAAEVAAERPLHIFRARPLIIVAVAALDEPGLELRYLREAGLAP
jgi:hypothetical protein